MRSFFATTLNRTGLFYLMLLDHCGLFSTFEYQTTSSTSVTISQPPTFQPWYPHANLEQKFLQNTNIYQNLVCIFHS